MMIFLFYAKGWHLLTKNVKIFVTEKANDIQFAVCEIFYIMIFPC